MNSSESVWNLFQSGARAAAENMAIDEALLENAGAIGAPVLRFYSWTEPAASFGYFQKYAEVEKLTPLRPLVRRPTGGGIVPHDVDWTYTLVFPPHAPWYSIKAVESYRRVHEWIQTAFANSGVRTALAPASRKEAPGQCFIGAEQFDVLCNEQKIAGAAQRRSRQGLLIQGSIHPPVGLAAEKWLEIFCQIARKQWNVQWAAFALSPGIAERAQQLAAEKYSRPEYNQKK